MKEKRQSRLEDLEEEKERLEREIVKSKERVKRLERVKIQGEHQSLPLQEDLLEL